MGEAPGARSGSAAPDPPAAMSDTSSGRPATRASSPTSFACSSARTWRVQPERPARASSRATGRDRPGAWASRTSSRGWASTAARSATRRRDPHQPARHEATAELTLAEAYHGTTRLVEVDGKRLEITIPPGADTGTKIKLTGKGPGGGDIVVVTKVQPDRTFTRKGADLERELALTLEQALLGADVTVETLKGRVVLTIPAGTQPGRTFRLRGQGMPKFKASGHGDLLVRAKVVLPTHLSEEATAAARTFFDLVKHTRPTLETPIMQLDRFTQKAQEAILEAQALAQRLDSPILDAEHILSALVEPDDGIPAETLRRLGVDLPGFRGELAAILARRARIQGGSLSMDPRARRVVEPAQAEATPSRRRVRLDRAPPARDRRGRRRGPGPARASRRRSRGPAPGAPERPRRPARHLAEPREHLRRAREVRPRPDDRGSRRHARPGHRARRRDPPRHPGARRAGPRTTRSSSASRASARRPSPRGSPSGSSAATSRRASRTSASSRSTSGRSSPAPSSAASSRSG